ncbi:MAG: recombinase family protein [Flavobacteriaceae bacterium]|nr:recombinase family protein [Flavobacteriaceae bacterium]MBL6692935.1 recombinase family protein [Flavobacteriaceae bacterium]
MMGAFSQLETEWRFERQMAGIRKAQEKGIYRNRNHHRRKQTQNHRFGAHQRIGPTGGTRV